MSEFDFFEPEIGNEAAVPPESPIPAASPETGGNTPEAAPQAPTFEQFNDLQKRLEASERWRQDFGRMVAENTGIMPQAQQKQDPQAALTEFLTDPIQFQQRTITEATRIARQEMEQAAIIQDRRAKHPELTQLESVINWESAMNAGAAQFHQKNGRPPSFAEALDASIELVKGNLQGLTSAGQTQQQGNVAMRMAMNLNPAGGGQPPQKQDLSTMSDADWVKYRDAAMRQTQGY